MERFFYSDWRTCRGQVMTVCFVVARIKQAFCLQIDVGSLIYTDQLKLNRNSDCSLEPNLNFTIIFFSLLVMSEVDII